jgi:hypothetical protein
MDIWLQWNQLAATNKPEGKFSRKIENLADKFKIEVALQLNGTATQDGRKLDSYLVRV